MADSDSEGNDDWTPSDMNIKPPGRDGGRVSGSRLEAPRAKRSMPEPPVDNAKRPIRLTVKQPSRLRHQMNTEDDGESEESSRPARQTLSRSSKQNKAPIVDTPNESEDDEEEDEDEDEVEGDEDEEEGSEEEEDAEDDDAEDDDAEGDEDEDVEMSEALTPAPFPLPKSSKPAKSILKLNNPNPQRKLSPGRVLQKGKQVESVEAKEIRMGGTGADSDDELSPLDASGDEMEGETGEEDEELDEMEEMDDDGEDDAIRASQISEGDLGSDSELDSEGGTPDPTKLTRRQRMTSPNALMALSNEAQKKKFFTAEQITMRRTEMARRRKDLSEKRNEQEKLDTLDRLLYKRAPVRRSKKEMAEEREREEFGTPSGEYGEEDRPRAGYVRTLMSANGTRVGVPREWEGKVVGSVFDGAKKMDAGLRIVGGSRMVQAVE